MPDDVNIYHLLYPAQAAPCRNPQTKSVVTIYDLAWARHPKTAPSVEAGKAMTNCIERQAQQADKIIAISQSTKDDLQTILHIPPEKIHVIYPGCDLSPLDESVKDESVLPAALPERYILCVGTWEPRKNLSNLLRAVKSLEGKFRERNIMLCLVGGKGWKYQAIESLIEELGLQDLIVALDYVSREYLPLLYARSLAFVYPSLYEGFGLPVLEAITCGAPVVTSNVSSLPEVTGDAALLIDPHAPDELTAAIEKLLDDESLREELRHKGFIRAREFSWEKAARETLALYHQC